MATDRTLDALVPLRLFDRRCGLMDSDYLAACETGTMYDFAIVSNGRFAGGCGINHINAQDRVANLGYWIRTSCTGQGIATSAVKLLVAWAFANTGLNRIEIVVAVDNHRSQRVAERVGAHQDAILPMRTMAQPPRAETDRGTSSQR